MKHFILYIIFQLLFNVVNGQQIPEYKNIGIEIANENSKFYYPKLFGRYIAADRELTLNDFRYLYYGFSFQDAYSPYASSEYRKNLTVFFNKKEITNNDLLQMIKYANLILRSFPFDLQSLQMLDYAYYHNNEREKSDDAEFKRKMIVKAILSTGTGLTKKSAIHIIYDINKFDLVNEKKLRYNGENRISNNVCEYLGVFKNDKNISGLFFNVSRMYEVSANRLKAN